MLEDEKQLIERAKGGEGQAFGLLYDHYLPRIYRFVLLKVSHREEAEDLTHLAFLKAWENIEKYSDLGFPFGSWLYHISRNIIIDHYRSSSHSAGETNIDDLAESLQDEQEPLETKIDRKLALSEIAKAIAQLKDVEQDVIIMRFVDDLPHEEVAKAIGKTEGAVKLIQHRAVKNLKKILENV
ncbi:MAG: hypothetical protein A3B23_02375 [Candidatus Colwellbacteria bacterium RIFCSPLOWO2_01_FULL_48_10]|uniref:RNA polymerase subunit sigma-24 n=2 Tax=Bacteria candidate phyla TaxID=1783234 RepID=A0A1F5P3V8_9BACT|nr:MAG: hypothetical protein A2846_03565 [Candidatus Doudnabacteria bacterium RIFCSPHIGHO2_01_FULL_49_9]OGY59968.1 MAG: hypothetical protein A3B23_02375 [Candidatus Colwellbacteria bacterium RIFCSPLOWO2_01_FULL_48_10]